MKKLIVYAVVSIALVTSVSAHAGDKQAAEKALSQARELMEKSVAIQGGWQSTKKLINEAELSVTKGSYDKATKLAKQAIREARLSFQQAQREKKDWSEPGYLSK